MTNHKVVNRHVIVNYLFFKETLVERYVNLLNDSNDKFIYDIIGVDNWYDYSGGYSNNSIVDNNIYNGGGIGNMVLFRSVLECIIHQHFLVSLS